MEKIPLWKEWKTKKQNKSSCNGNKDLMCLLYLFGLHIHSFLFFLFSRQEQRDALKIKDKRQPQRLNFPDDGGWKNPSSY